MFFIFNYFIFYFIFLFFRPPSAVRRPPSASSLYRVPVDGPVTRGLISGGVITGFLRYVCIASKCFCVAVKIYNI